MSVFFYEFYRVLGSCMRRQSTMHRMPVEKADVESVLAISSNFI
jgi:hypothetical protein